MQKAMLEPTPDQTFEVIGEGPYDFEKVLAHTRRMQREGDVEGACNARFRAFQRLAELIPEDEEVNLEWNHRNSRAALELIHASAIDHFLINDFEMSAALLEMLLDLDPEDHLEGSQLLAFDYLAMGEDELFDEVINDLKRFRSHFAPWFEEFTAAEHPADEAYLRDIESEHPTAAAQARELWLQTENLWSLWPVFIDALRAAR